VHSVY